MEEGQRMGPSPRHQRTGFPDLPSAEEKGARRGSALTLGSSGCKEPAEPGGVVSVLAGKAGQNLLVFSPVPLTPARPHSFSQTF